MVHAYNGTLRKVRTSFVTLLPLCLIVIGLAGCTYDTPAAFETRSAELDREARRSRVFDGRDSVATGSDRVVATQDNSVIVTDFVRIRDVIVRDGEKAFFFTEISDPDHLDPSTPLYEGRENNPILDTSGDQVTWGAFSDADASVVVKCTQKGTRAVSHLSGLIPKGVYSVWIDVFEPGTDNRLGRLSYTETDQKGKGKGNVLRASGTGEGHISGLVEPRTLGDAALGNCMLNDVENDKYDWRITGIYHIDGTPGIDEANDSGTFVEQTGSLYETDSPPVIE